MISSTLSFAAEGCKRAAAKLSDRREDIRAPALENENKNSPDFKELSAAEFSVEKELQIRGTKLERIDVGAFLRQELYKEIVR